MWGRGAARRRAGACPGAGTALPRPNSATQWQHTACSAPFQRRSCKPPKDAVRKRVRGYSFKEYGVQSFQKSCRLYPAHNLTAQELWQRHRFKVSFSPGYFGDTATAQPQQQSCQHKWSAAPQHRSRHRQPHYKHLGCQSSSARTCALSSPCPLAIVFLIKRPLSVSGESFPRANISNR